VVQEVYSTTLESRESLVGTVKALISILIHEFLVVDISSKAIGTSIQMIPLLRRYLPAFLLVERVVKL
jgi:hypothetical protein